MLGQQIAIDTFWDNGHPEVDFGCIILRFKMQIVATPSPLPIL